MRTARDWADNVGRAECRSYIADTDSSHYQEMVFVLGDAHPMFGGYYMSIYAGSLHIYTCLPDVDFMVSVVIVPLDEDIEWWVDEVLHTGKWDFTDPDSFVSKYLAKITGLYA